ncbi:MAG: hypothetical protein FWD58_09020, partial [Firmicutes bacterium]|nr:hypothetical protein [Bacillota bacterium]
MKKILCKCIVIALALALVLSFSGCLTRSSRSSGTKQPSDIESPARSAAAQAFIDAVDSLPSESNVTLAHKSSVQAAKALYDALSVKDRGDDYVAKAYTKLAVLTARLAALEAFGDPSVGQSAEEYALKRLVVKSVLGDTAITVADMSAADKALYDSVITMYGGKVTVKPDTIEFSGTVTALYNPAKYALIGVNVVFESAAVSAVFNEARLAGGVFSFGVSQAGTGFVFEYESGGSDTQPPDTSVSPVVSVSLSTVVQSLTVGHTFTLTATLHRQDGTTATAAAGQITWISSDATVATFSASGVASGIVTGIKAGTAVVSAALSNNFTVAANCIVTVTAPAPIPSTAISTLAGLRALSVNKSSAITGSYHLTADINATSAQWETLGDLAGTFDGRGYSITIMRTQLLPEPIASTTIYGNCGIFRNVLPGAVVKNLAVKGSGTVTYQSWSGAICQQNAGTISNCYA